MCAGSKRQQAWIGETGQRRKRGCTERRETQKADIAKEGSDSAMQPHTPDTRVFGFFLLFTLGTETIGNCADGTGCETVCAAIG